MGAGDAGRFYPFLTSRPEFLLSGLELDGLFTVYLPVPLTGVLWVATIDVDQTFLTPDVKSYCSEPPRLNYVAFIGFVVTFPGFDSFNYCKWAKNDLLFCDEEIPEGIGFIGFGILAVPDEEKP